MSQVATVPFGSTRKIGFFNLGTAVVLGLIGFFVGAWLGHLVGANVHYNQVGDQNDIAVVFAYLGFILGFLGGLGFLNYPVAKLLGKPVPALDKGDDRSVWAYLRMNTDHKVVGVQYMIGALFFFLSGGLAAMFIRAELLSPNPGFLWTPGQYLTLVGMHGTMMILVTSAGLLGPFANYLLPIMIGAKRMAFPRIESLAFWLVPLAGLILLTAPLFGGFPSGWTGYQPLVDQAAPGVEAYLFAFLLLGTAMTLIGVNVLATVMTMRAPGLTWSRLPMFVWGAISTALLMLLSSPVLAAAILLVILDRTASTAFFIPAFGGSAFLWANLFWFFGHPEVYILAIPGFAIVLEILPVFARKPVAGYRLAVAGMMGVALLSFMVWQHHLFMSGMNAPLRPFYMLTTELISVPTGFVFLNGMMTLWKSKIRLEPPMLFALAFFFNFLIGGVTGVYNSDVPADVVDHGSFFTMAHFHYTIMGGLVFAMFAAIYFWGPKMFGYKFNKRLSQWHFWTMFVFFNSTFMPLFAVGLLGQPRRVSTYAPSLHGLNVWVSVSAFLLGASFLIFVVNFIKSLVFDRIPAEENPWESKGIEWMLPTPVPVNNFVETPVFLTTPYEYGVVGAPLVADLHPSRTAAQQGV